MRMKCWSRSSEIWVVLVYFEGISVISRQWNELKWDLKVKSRDNSSAHIGILNPKTHTQMGEHNRVDKSFEILRIFSDRVLLSSWWVNNSLPFAHPSSDFTPSYSLLNLTQTQGKNFDSKFYCKIFIKENF
jgi:hypothetical protein